MATTKRKPPGASSTAGEPHGPIFVAIPFPIAGSDLSFAAKLLYGLLRLHAGLGATWSPDETQTRDCYPGEDTLARELGNKSDRYVRMLINQLRDARLISWRLTGRSNKYRVFPPTRLKSDRSNCSAVDDRNIDSAVGEDKAARPAGVSQYDENVRLIRQRLERARQANRDGDGHLNGTGVPVRMEHRSRPERNGDTDNKNIEEDTE